MVCLAHSWCEEPLVNRPDENDQSMFTCVVEADNVDRAHNKLRNLNFTLRENHGLLASTTEIYLEDLTEIRRVPYEKK